YRERQFRPVQAERPLSVGKAVLRCCKGGRRGCADSGHCRRRAWLSDPKQPFLCCDAAAPGGVDRREMASAGSVCLAHYELQLRAEPRPCKARVSAALRSAASPGRVTLLHVSVFGALAEGRP